MTDGDNSFWSTSTVAREFSKQYRTEKRRETSIMPPKKKGKGKKKKGKKKDDDELRMEDMYKRSVQEVDSLKDKLAERKAYARHTRAEEEVMRDKMVKAKEMVTEERESKKSIAGDLTRQYMTMQFQLETKVEYLESKVMKLQQTLDQTTAKLAEVQAERDAIQVEKEEEVGNLQLKIQSMEKSYEMILQDVFDALAVKMDAARQKWDVDSHRIDRGTLDILSEFGRELKPTSSTFK